jgi:hypothetical protein
MQSPHLNQCDQGDADRIHHEGKRPAAGEAGTEENIVDRSEYRTEQAAKDVTRALRAR